MRSTGACSDGEEHRGRDVLVVGQKKEIDGSHAKPDERNEVGDRENGVENHFPIGLVLAYLILVICGIR